MKKGPGMLVGYVRVSSTEQAAANRSSLKEQERRIRGVAMMRGVDQYEVTVFSDPGVSGSISLAKRPAGKEMLESLQAGDMIVAAKLDRIFRSASDALYVVEMLQEKGIGVILADIGTDPVTENGVSKLFFSMLAAFAEFERTRINERMADGRRAKKEKGGVLGEVPYGWKKQGKGRDAMLVEDDYETAIARRVCGLMNCKPWPEVERILLREGIVNRKGNPFTWTSATRIRKRHNPLIHGPKHDEGRVRGSDPVDLSALPGGTSAETEGGHQGMGA